MKRRPAFEEFTARTILDLVRDCLLALDKLIIAIHHLVMHICADAGIDLMEPERRGERVAPFTPAREVRLPAFILFG